MLIFLSILLKRQISKLREKQLLCQTNVRSSNEVQGLNFRRIRMVKLKSEWLHSTCFSRNFEIWRFSSMERNMSKLIDYTILSDSLWKGTFFHSLANKICIYLMHKEWYIFDHDMMRHVNIICWKNGYIFSSWPDETSQHAFSFYKLQQVFIEPDLVLCFKSILIEFSSYPYPIYALKILLSKVLHVYINELL